MKVKLDNRFWLICSEQSLAALYRLKMVEDPSSKMWKLACGLFQSLSCQNIGTSGRTSWLPSLQHAPGTFTGYFQWAAAQGLQLLLGHNKKTGCFRMLGRPRWTGSIGRTKNRSRLNRGRMQRPSETCVLMPGPHAVRCSRATPLVWHRCQQARPALYRRD